MDVIILVLILILVGKLARNRVSGATSEEEASNIVQLLI